MRHYFGTDGIRGRVGEGYITPDFVLKLGWAAVKLGAYKSQSPIDGQRFGCFMPRRD
jgi:phosphoglucosamine mutase